MVIHATGIVLASFVLLIPANGSCGTDVSIFSSLDVVSVAKSCIFTSLYVVYLSASLFDHLEFHVINFMSSTPSFSPQVIGLTFDHRFNCNYIRWYD